MAKLTTYTTGAAIGAADLFYLVQGGASFKATGAQVKTWAQSGLGTASALASDTDGTLAANSDTRLATQKATKTYVDSKLAGLSWKQAVRAASTANGTLATAFENGDTLDGVTLATGDRILLKNQSSAAENGIYTVNASGAPTRATDADAGAELVNASVYVSEGTANADTQWTCTTNAPITPGSTSLAFAQLTSGGVSAFTGLSDVPASYSGQSLKAVRVNAGETALEFYTPAGGSGVMQHLIFKPADNEAPLSNPATIDTRNNHPVLNFDDTTSEVAIFSGVLPSTYAGGGINVAVHWCTLTATTGTVGWLVAIERIGTSQNIAADSFASDATITATTCAGSAGQVSITTVNISNGSAMDSLAAGEGFRIRIKRDVANDNVSGDAQLIRCVVKEQ
jgi:hypothetical protein